MTKIDAYPSKDALDQRCLEITDVIQPDNTHPHQIIAYIEPWRRLKEKLGIQSEAEETAQIHTYSKYDPHANTLQICYICGNAEQYSIYHPSELEAKQIKAAIATRIQKLYHCTPMEFCEQCQAACIFLCHEPDGHWCAKISDDAPTGSSMFLTEEAAYPVDLCYEHYDAMANAIVAHQICQSREELLAALNMCNNNHNTILSLWDYNLLLPANEHLLASCRTLMQHSNASHGPVSVAG